MGDRTKAKLFKTPMRSDSDESVDSCTSESSTAGLTLLAEYDEIIRGYKACRQDDVIPLGIDLCNTIIELQKRLKMSMGECVRLQLRLDEKTHMISELESKLHLARKMVDQEKRYFKKTKEENLELKEQMRLIKEVLFSKNQKHVLSNEATEKLKFLNDDISRQWDPNVSAGKYPLGAIHEGNTTGSLLSDFSFSRSEDDLDSAMVHANCNWKKARPSSGPEPTSKKRRSSTYRAVEINKNDSVRATTTLTVLKSGPITATSIIESIPSNQDANLENKENKKYEPTAPPADIIYEMWQENQNQGGQSNQRPHSLQTKTVVLPETCRPCEKKLRFGKTALKCKDCRAICHPECKNNLPLPCVPYVSTPNRNFLGLISDYTPTSSPMIPALIIHCLNEIENRGLHELGLYRIPGSEKEVKLLKEKFLRGKGSPCLNQLDIHVICGTVKDFLRNLHEPLITYKLWPKFCDCVEQANEYILPGLQRLISELPQPNRDTLAYMLLHLKRVSNSPDCKMPITNLAKVFGPTIVGYSSSNPSPEVLFTETRRQNMVMEFLMNLPNEYWSSLIQVQAFGTPKLQQTPSTDSLLRQVNRNYFTPNAARSAHKENIFKTPPRFR